MQRGHAEPEPWAGLLTESNSLSGSLQSKKRAFMLNPAFLNIEKTVRDDFLEAAIGSVDMKISSGCKSRPSRDCERLEIYRQK
jgi:hypothetical protein